MDALKFAEENYRLGHAIQSGVKFEIEAGITDSHSPKHLRTGVNLALCGEAALTDLLIKKGIITEEEYFDSQVEGMKREVAEYEARLSAHFGKPVTLI